MMEVSYNPVRGVRKIIAESKRTIRKSKPEIIQRFNEYKSIKSDEERTNYLNNLNQEEKGQLTKLIVDLMVVKGLESGLSENNNQGE